MVLNYIWITFFVVAFAVALVKLIFCGDTQVFTEIVNSTFSSAKNGFEISLGLTGVLALWMGIMRVGECGGAVNLLSKAMSPLFAKLFPGLKKDSPAYGPIMLNIAANMLGLDNAATPMGLKAMNAMQQENSDKSRASDAQIMFLVINTSGLTIIPVSILVYRTQLGAANPTDVFIPILIATFVSTLVGIISVALIQKIKLFQKTILAYLGGATLFVAAVVWCFSTLSQSEMVVVSNVASGLILFSIIVLFIGMAAWRKENVYNAFIEGAKSGFGVAIKIIPYLIAVLVAIGVFRASGAMDMLLDGFAWCVNALGFNADWVPAMPTALMKPLSGSGARGMMVDAMTTYGADSFVGRLACLFQGATDTTFYIIAVYFGAVGIKNTRYAVPCGLFADFAGIITAIFMGYLFFS